MSSSELPLTARRCITCKRPHHGEVGTSDWALYESAKGRRGIICPDCMSPEARSISRLNAALIDARSQGFGLDTFLQKNAPLQRGNFYGVTQ